MNHLTTIFVILNLLAGESFAQIYSMVATPNTLTFDVTSSPSQPQSYTIQNTGNSFMYVMISPSAHTQISFNSGSTWLSVNNNAYLLNPFSSMVVYVRVVTSNPIDILNEQISNTRFTYATPTAPVQIAGAAPLPISLASFNATAVSRDAVELKWKTISETDNYGFVVQRLVGNEWTDVSPLIPGHGTTIEIHEYSYTDQVDFRNKWRLCQIDLDGSKSFSGVVMTTDVRPASEVTEFALGQNYPNPFNPSTTIRYGMPHKTVVQLTVFNTLGQQVAQLVNGEQEAGYHEVKFDGSGLSSGVYLYRLRAGDFMQTRKFVLMK